MIRCTPGTSRFQGQGTPKLSRSGNKFRTAGTSRIQSTSRGSMFQASQASNSVFTFRNSRKGFDDTISADPAIKKRGPARDFDDTFMDD